MVADNRASVEVRGLAKRFGEVQAVVGVDFEVGAGELFGFLGPNGAGKSTTINMLIGLARSDAGTIRIAEIDCTKNTKAVQHLMGVVPDESNLYPELTGFDNLAFCGALYGMTRPDREARVRELLDRFGLADAGGRKFGSYSKGMKRKLTIAAGIIHAPPILFLDEPTTGTPMITATILGSRLTGPRKATRFERLFDRIAGYLSRRWIIQAKGEQWFKEKFLHVLTPITIIALLTTLVLLFSFKGETILNNPLTILWIAIPLFIQTNLIFWLGYWLARLLKLSYQDAAPAAMIGASNHFEVAIATATMLLGLSSGAALATVVGVLIEVPVMLMLVKICLRTQDWFRPKAVAIT